ncbi:unnamed protein product, partial [Rotaria sp. Silwood1]
SSINTLITTDTRRSVRLSAKSSKRISSLNQSSSTDTQRTSTSSISYSTITSTDNGGMHDSNNKNSTSYRDLLPSGQSDDDEISTNNSVVIKQKSTGLLTLSEVLSYFLVQDNSYKCNLCDQVYECHKYSAANLLSVVSPERKRELHTAAVNCILRDGLALGVFRQPGMSQFLQIAVPGYAGPNGKTVRQKIAAIYSSYTTKLRSVLSKVDFFALTCDLWRSSKRVHYISLTGHVFTNKYKTVSIVLGCHRVIGRHLSTTIERYIEFELKRLNIKQEQLVSITTDNGSDMKKATSTLKFGDDTSHNDPTDDECDSDSDDDINFSSLTINDNKLSSIDHYKLILSVFNLMKKARAGVKFIRNHNGTNEYVIKHVEEFKSIINQMSNISNLLMKRVIITKGFCDLIYDISNNTFQVIEQERDYLENCQKLESTSSPTT